LTELAETAKDPKCQTEAQSYLAKTAKIYKFSVGPNSSKLIQFQE